MIKEIDQKQYSYGKLRTYIHEHDFQTVFTDTAGVIRDDVKQAEEVIFRFDQSGGGVNKQTYNSSFKKYFIVEVRDSMSKTNAQVTRVVNGNVKGLIVKLNGKCFASYNNVGSAPAMVDLSSAILPGNTNEIHFSRLDSMVNFPIRISNSSYSLPANEQILLVSSNDPADLGRGYQNYTELLKMRDDSDIATSVISTVKDKSFIQVESVVKDATNNSMLATIISQDATKVKIRLVDTNGVVRYQGTQNLSEGKNVVRLPNDAFQQVFILHVDGENGGAVSRKIVL
jgi:hypothetical protein